MQVRLSSLTAKWMPHRSGFPANVPSSDPTTCEMQLAGRAVRLESLTYLPWQIRATRLSGLTRGRTSQCGLIGIQTQLFADNVEMAGSVDANPHAVGTDA